MKSRAVRLGWAVVLVCGAAGAAQAADLSLGSWTYSWDEHARINFSVPVDNDGPTDSGALLITLWATADPRDSSTLTHGFRLVEVQILEGLAAFEGIEVSSGFQDHVEEPEPGTYNIAVTVDEQAGPDASPRLLSFSPSQLTFPMDEVPSQAEIRRRVASAVPCGSLFVQFSLVTFVGLCLTRWIACSCRSGR